MNNIIYRMFQKYKMRKTICENICFKSHLLRVDRMAYKEYGYAVFLAKLDLTNNMFKYCMNNCKNECQKLKTRITVEQTEQNTIGMN